MDYKYIEQLLERYWNCQTTLEEEEILRAFFNQEDIPAGLIKYRGLFVYEHQSVAEESLGEDFDEKVLALVSEERGNARITILSRFTPLLRAVAIVCFLITLGAIVEHSISYQESLTPAAVMAQDQDTVSIADPSVAYENGIKTDTIEIREN